MCIKVSRSLVFLLETRLVCNSLAFEVININDKYTHRISFSILLQKINSICHQHVVIKVVSLYGGGQFKGKKNGTDFLSNFFCVAQQYWKKKRQPFLFFLFYSCNDLVLIRDFYHENCPSP